MWTQMSFPQNPNPKVYPIKMSTPYFFMLALAASSTFFGIPCRCYGSTNINPHVHPHLPDSNEVDPKAPVCLPCRFLLDKSNFRFKHVHSNSNSRFARPQRNECLEPMGNSDLLNHCMSQLCIKYAVLSTNWTQHAKQVVLDYVESQTPGCRVSLDDPTMDETNISVCYCGVTDDVVDEDDDDVSRNNGEESDHDPDAQAEINRTDSNNKKEVDKDTTEAHAHDRISETNFKFHFPLLKKSRPAADHHHPVKSKLVQGKTHVQSENPLIRNEDPNRRICKKKESAWEVNINYGEKILGFEMTLFLPFYDSSVRRTQSSVTFKSPSCILNRK